MKKSILIILILICTVKVFAQSYLIGSTYEGGIIFYLEPGGAWGLAAAPNDLPAGLWAQAIASCKTVELGNKGNWRLPTIEELRILYENRVAVGNFTSGNQEYWSATEVILFGLPNYALTKSFAFGSFGGERTVLKGLESLSVRPVRRFYVPLTGETGEPACLPVTGGAYVPGPAFVNYGNGIGIQNNTRRMNVSIGEMVVGLARDNEHSGDFGSTAQFLTAPFATLVSASQGELLDRIQISWAPNPLGPLPTEGFELYRDGIFLGAFGPGIRNFNDFNVIAGRPYKYEVAGINLYGKGALGAGLGFQVPNGVATGYVETLNGNPVPDALVTLMPMQGFSMMMGKNDLAFAQDSVGFLNNATQWSLCTWVQTDSAAAAVRMFKFEGNTVADSSKWWLSPLKSSGGHEGLKLNVSAQSLTIQFPDSTKNGWHHVAITHDGSMFRAYLDGVLVGSIIAAANSGTAKIMNIGGEGSKWVGRMDELRIYHKKLDELDFGEIMEGTASSLTPGLKFYWKMDEELGTKSFDLIRRTKLFFCGAGFDASRPPVRTSGKTNAQGYYRIESASYGTGTTFLAEPMKLFYMHRALKFNRSESDYASLPNFGLTDSTELETATLEMWVNSAGPDGPQCLLSKKWNGQEFRVTLTPSGNNNILKCYLNGTEQAFGNLGVGYQHLAFTFQQASGNTTVKAYKNGVLGGTGNFSGMSGNWSDTSQVWLLGARANGASRTDYFGGLIDEVAMYDTLLSPASISGHVTASRDLQERHLRAYFSLDEGSGNVLNNLGSQLTGAGTTFGTDWSSFCAIQETSPHVFTPATRQVTLNPSVTSVDNVDFTDRSTVAVVGYVRYVNTDCFAQKVEILVNGSSFNPAIYTDSTGRFVVDLEPGATVTLTPKFEDHQFIPAFRSVVNISSPIAGVLFTDMTTRTVTGVVAGGLCHLSIIKNPGTPQGTICKVKIRSTDGCYEKVQQILTTDGVYEFTDLPPTEMTIAVIQHSDPTIKTAFEVQGGGTVDLAKQDTTYDFIYFAPPVLEIASGLDTIAPCSQVVFEQGDLATLHIRMAEDYYGERCYADSASLKILNGWSGASLDTTISNGTFVYKFTVGVPNPAPPFMQTLQIIGTTLEGNEVSLTKQAIITGVRNKETTFTTLMPEIPTLILRDPPGDGSYSYFDKNNKSCRTTTVSFDYEVGGGAGLELHLGGNVEVVVGLFAATIINTGVIFDVDAQAQVTYQKITENSFETCVTVDQRISTSDDDLHVGRGGGGDVYMGEAINMIFGLADMVVYNPATCTAKDSVVLNLQPDSIPTTFVYSEFNIKKNVLRYLALIAADSTKSMADRNRATESINRWNAIIMRNEGLKEKAKFKRNLSFDAGINLEYSETNDYITDKSLETLLNSEESLETHFGYQFNEFGVTGNLKFVSATSKSTRKSTGEESGITVGYVLKDDDPGDAFTVDVAMDSVYNTPVFRTRSGQSSCPWEPGTAHREGTLLTMRDGSDPMAIDVPANEPAVYKFTLANASQTNELRTYAFTTGPESNPDGAVIKLNGAVLDHPVYFAIPYGESIPVTLTLERGPEKYDYDDLEVVLYSECEDTRAGILGILPDDDGVLYSAIYISAHFIQPCSEVNINVPEQNWVIHPDPTTMGTDDVLTITASGYDKSQADLQKIKMQYRSSKGDGAWLNITPLSEVLKADLDPISTNFFWNTAGLSDGDYEIRAVAVCGGDASGKPGYSQIIKGRIDRQPPGIVGVPEPSDGVYQVGDEISITFNKDIDCGKIFPDLMGDVNNVGLYDAITNTLIDAQISCFENKIILTPNFQNEFFENHILRVDLHNIPDKTGNVLPAFDWEFYVDRNELAWLTDSIGTVKYDDESKVLTAKIHNRAGSPVPFTIQNVPSWLRVVPDAGTLVPNEIREIRFEIDSLLAIGMWSDSIILHTETGQNPFFMGGDEGLPLGVRVICRPPQWKINTGLYPNTMNFAVKLNIEGVNSIDPEDQVAAYIDNTLRGSAKVQYVPSFNAWMAFLTVYGNPEDVDAPIDLEIWDASACLRYGDIVEQYEFHPDDLIGAADNPVVLHTSGQVLREIPLAQGWNWISLNLSLPDPAINPVLGTLIHPEDDYIKSQASFSEYFGSAWFGSLDTLGNTSMYQYRANLPDTLKLIGELIDPSMQPIPFTAGWNWISYLPNKPLPVDEALVGLSPLTGDLIKGQFGFAQYIANFGWIGNLSHLMPPQGYQLRMANAGVLNYPVSNFLPNGPVERGDKEKTTAYWQVNPAAFEYSMTLIGMISANGANATLSTQELGAFVGNQLRGAVQAIYVQPLDAYLFFLTTYSNQPGEQLHFKTYNSATGQIDELHELLWFAADLHQGSIGSPVPFTLQSTGVKEFAQNLSLEVQPNPFHGEATIWFSRPQSGEVNLTVSDAQGKIMMQQKVAATAGLNTFKWRAEGAAAGVYFIRLESPEGVVMRKVVKS